MRQTALIDAHISSLPLASKSEIKLRQNRNGCGSEEAQAVLFSKRYSGKCYPLIKLALLKMHNLFTTLLHDGQ